MRYLLPLVIVWAGFSQGLMLPGPGTTATAAAPKIGPVDFYTDLNGTSAGNTITTGILNGGTRGNVNHGGWTITGTGLTTSAHQSGCTLGGSVQIDGTVYATSNPSLSMSVNNSGSLRYITASAATPSVGYTQAVALVCFTQTWER